MSPSYLVLQHDRLTADRLDVGERVEHALGETQVVHRTRDLAVLDEKGAVARHARQDGLRRLDDVHVVESRDPEATIDSRHELGLIGVASIEEEVKRHRAIAVGSWQRMAGGLLALS